MMCVQVVPTDTVRTQASVFFAYQPMINVCDTELTSTPLNTAVLSNKITASILLELVTKKLEEY